MSEPSAPDHYAHAGLVCQAASCHLALSRPHAVDTLYQGRAGMVQAFLKKAKAPGDKSPGALPTSVLPTRILQSARLHYCNTHAARSAQRSAITGANSEPRPIWGLPGRPCPGPATSVSPKCVLRKARNRRQTLSRGLLRNPQSAFVTPSPQPSPPGEGVGRALTPTLSPRRGSRPRPHPGPLPQERE